MQPDEKNPLLLAPKPKLHLLLKLAIALSIISLFCSITSIFLFGNPSLSSFIVPTMLMLPAFFAGLLSVPLYLAAVIFATDRRWLAFGLGVASFFILIIFGAPAAASVHTHGYSLACQSNFAAIKKAVLLYSETHGDFLPDPNWCDKLLQTDSRLNHEHLYCRVTDRRHGQSSYALNKNLIGRKFTDANPDTVMLFEVNPGWNQTADSNELSLNHNSGCNVLFVNGRIRFIPKDKIPTLRWNP